MQDSNSDYTALATREDETSLPLISRKKSNRANLVKFAIFFTFLLAAFVAIANRRTVLHNEEMVAMVEEQPPPNAPLIDVTALTRARQGWPTTQLAYSWRKDKMDAKATAEEQARVAAAQKTIQNFPPKPVIVHSAATGKDQRCYATTGTIDGQKVVILGFPGTESMDDWKRDFQSLTTEPWKGFQTGKGFVKRYNEHMQAEDFRKKVDALIQKENPAAIWCVGHSLGGALATLCATDFVTSGKKVVAITFGQPRVFKADDAVKVNQNFKLGNAKGNEFIRIVNFGDMIPSTPQSTLGYEHVGRPYYLNKPVAGEFTLQEKHQDFTAPNAAVFTAMNHMMGSYEKRIEEVEAAAQKNKLYSGGQMGKGATGLMGKAKAMLKRAESEKSVSNYEEK